MPSINYQDGASNRAITSVTYGDGGTSRTVTEVWYGDGGTNRLVFAAVNLLGLDPSSTVLSPADASATYSLTSAGLETATGSSSNTWLLAGSAASYDVRATLNSGALTSGTTGSWLNLGTTRSWNVTRTSNVDGTDTANLTIEIRSASSLAVLATATVVITARVLV